MDDGGLPAFNKKIRSVRELCAVGFLHLTMMLYIFLLLFENEENKKPTL
jgi:hypothetical protein